jgi:hypothetical protein
MKFLSVAVACMAAVSLAACVHMPELEAANSAVKPAEADPVAARARLDTLKEVNRHIETCDRTYAWPFSVMIVCKAQAPVTRALTAEDISALVSKAVAEALAKATPAH